MRPGRLLTIGAAVAAAVHVIGVLFARPVWRPAEVLATLCLLGFAIHHDRRDSGRPRWALSAATAVLVLEAALTVPPAPGTGSGLLILSPEEYSGLLRHARLTSAVPVLAALLFVLVLLVAARNPAGRRAGIGRRAAMVGCGAAVVVLAWVVVRVAASARASGLLAGVAAVLPLLLVLAALALATLTAARRQWRAALGAALLAAAGVIWIEIALGGALVPYQLRDSTRLFGLDLIRSTPALPEPTQALIAAIVLTAAILTVTGLARRAA